MLSGIFLVNSSNFSSRPSLKKHVRDSNALLAADMNAVLGGTVVVGLVFVGLNLLSDLLYRVFDPRASSGEE